MCFFARAVFFWSRKEGEVVCGSQQFFSSSFTAEKKKGWPDNPGFLQQKRGSHIICIWVYFLQKGFLIDQIQMTVFG